jgi:protein gp37
LGAIDHYGFHSVIVGGKSGYKARPVRKEWVNSVKRQCDHAEVAFFFKQWGRGGDGRTGRSASLLSPHASRFSGFHRGE